jgi:hypothetical protein
MLFTLDRVQFSRSQKLTNSIQYIINLQKTHFLIQSLALYTYRFSDTEQPLLL